MCQKIEDSFRHPLDGMPATKGTPLVTEARYYHNFFMAESEVSFDDFLAALSRELSSKFPGVSLNSDWIRECDRRGLVASARRDLALLRASIEQGRVFSVGVWEMLWKINDIYIEKFGLTYDQLETSKEELHNLAQQYLTAECEKRVLALKALMHSTSIAAARRMFRVLDNMLGGVAISLPDFANEWQVKHMASGPYRAYSRTIAMHRLSAEDIGWSAAERIQTKSRLYPDGIQPQPKATHSTEVDPTAPAVSACEQERHQETQNFYLDPAANEDRGAAFARMAAAWCVGLAESLTELLTLPEPAPQVS